MRCFSWWCGLAQSDCLDTEAPTYLSTVVHLPLQVVLHVQFVFTAWCSAAHDSSLVLSSLVGGRQGQGWIYAEALGGSQQQPVANPGGQPCLLETSAAPWELVDKVLGLATVWLGES